ncbi:hypothetical protein NE237_010523 [Protea cynaroides]|uniref:RRM domain-containing protein n=1 Tax=Protea cynaroides TaxID=273540 RepID=A0A9Q0KZP9_9MAGN|nr:hypothetical protein NE237_010523 [Protea cynaroides]
MASVDVEFRCFVGGLAWVTDDQALERAFSRYGKIIESKIISDRETGRSRGFGFVTFRDEQSMRDAIERMNDQDLDGRNITVKKVQTRGGGGGGGDGYCSRDGGSYGGGGGGYGRREAERLVEFSDKASDSSKSKQTKSYNKGKGEGEKKDSSKSFRKPSKGKEEPKKTGCFLCDGDHRVRDCPQKKALNGVKVDEDKDVPCMVPVVYEKQGRSVEFISALQLTKGLKKGKITYVASLREEEDMGPKKAQPQEIEAVLNEYKDIIPNELPKKLPPRREVDHEIELVSGAKPPAMAPYRGVLMQDGHPIAYESCKLNETERRYTVQEKEMTAVVHCLRIWCHKVSGQDRQCCHKLLSVPEETQPQTSTLARLLGRVRYGIRVSARENQPSG